ncbi:MAG: valine--tRNA ligase [Candidatus Sericytochromatia bacterium]|nr:valine--tRNA ligase [Candidatus Sericytochromatia bacterium]
MSTTDQAVPTSLPTTYSSQEIEARWAAVWEERGYFHPDVDDPGEPYCIAVPPPNVTGSLHIGHAVNATIQDALCRWHRQHGFNVLWVGGTDHAGIATQNVVEKMIKRTEGKSRHDLGREAFIERVWAWKQEYGDRIFAQWRRIGASIDFGRTRFTMDEGYSRAVRTVFVEWFNRGLIYRGLRSVNWCTQCLTTLSDLEVEHTEAQDSFYHVRYRLADGSGEIVIATVRPETIMADVAVAVHPDDPRYQGMIGKQVHVPCTDRTVPIIADTYVERDFGTGALKITPAHDPNDYEIGKRHSLPVLTVISQDGKMTAEAGARFEGQSIIEGRKAVVAELQSNGLMVKVDPYTHNVGSCYRCQTAIEPLLSEQWFVKMDELAAKALAPIQSGEIKFHPERWTGPASAWLENIRDWCISRQLWWGHQIPIWYCSQGHTFAALTDPTQCATCGDPTLQQDPDVLDTWFSSALWPFATLGWPDKTPDLAKWHPTNVLSTARDILNLWVARMIFSAEDLVGEAPFQHVVIHATILDAQGQRMSKSKGTGVDPLDMIDQFGADACRFWMAGAGTSSQDVRFSQEKIEASRNFVTKIWNASRFVLSNLTGYEHAALPPVEELSLADRWILSRLRATTDAVAAGYASFNLNQCTDAIYGFVWDEYCDWYLEIAKPRLHNEADRPLVQRVLATVPNGILKLLHPFMPFVTEELWSHLKVAGWSDNASHLANARGIDPESLPYDPTAIEAMERIMDVVRTIRNLRAELKVPPGTVAPKVHLTPESEALRQVFESGAAYISRLSRTGEVVFGEPDEAQVAVGSVAGSGVILPLPGLIDLSKERERLVKERDKLARDTGGLAGRLANEGFIAKAPPAVVEKERQKLADMQGELALLDERLKALA